MDKEAVLKRLMGRVTKDAPGGCWRWNGYRGKDGYGRAKTGTGLSTLVHRAVYEMIVGPVPAGLELDHTCRVRHCCNPAHLEPVAHQENCQRGELGVVAASIQREKTHCPKGHPLSGDNLYIRPGPKPDRGCRTCRREQVKACLRRRAASCQEHASC